MQLCATACNFVQLCATVCNCVQLCTTVYNCVQLCTTVYNCVQLCDSLYQPFCQEGGSPRHLSSRCQLISISTEASCGLKVASGRSVATERPRARSAAGGRSTETLYRRE